MVQRTRGVSTTEACRARPWQGALLTIRVMRGKFAGIFRNFMQHHCSRWIVAVVFLLHAVSGFAAEGEPAHRLPGNLPTALALMVVFAFVGVVVAILGYRMFDKFTPGDLHKEIVENKNVAAAIVAGAVIVGVCIIVAAAMFA
jgi:cytochrome b subunit of formate dehydrogenase